MHHNDSAALRSFHRKPCFHEKILQKRMMCEVCEAESTSGGVSRRVDVVGSSGADFDHIGPRIGEGAEKKALTFNFAPTLAKPFFYLLIYIFSANKKWFLRNRSTNVEFST